MNQRKKVVYVTGTRAEYGMMRSTLKAIEQRPELELYVIAVGMHLEKKYGSTVREIEKDGFRIIGRVRPLSSRTDQVSMSRNMGHYQIKITEILARQKMDMLLVLGDRGEALAAALAAMHLGMAIAHVSGGDVTEGGMVDDNIRHAITKLAHIHFPGTDESARRISMMLEEKKRIFMVGTPDIMTRDDFSDGDRAALASALGIDPGKPTVLVLQHPVTNEQDRAGEQMRETMEAVKALGTQAVVIYPNSDAGSRDMIKVIEGYSGTDRIKIRKNLPFRDFMCLLSLSSVMVGNSSAGISRAPGFGLPFLNVGGRQKGRERSANVIDTSYDREGISAAIKRLLESGGKRVGFETPYKKMPTDKLIAEILATTEINEEFLRKKYA